MNITYAKQEFKKEVLRRKIFINEKCFGVNDVYFDNKVDNFFDASGLFSILKKYDELELKKVNFSGISISMYFVTEDNCLELAYGWERINQNENADKLREYIKKVESLNSDKMVIYSVNFDKFFLEFKSHSND